MRILIGYEVSGRVREAFRLRGHDACSCDILPTLIASEYHYQGDITLAVEDGPWDMGIFFPPCTHLSVSGALHFKDKLELQALALGEVRYLMDLPIPRIAIENPVGVISTRIRKPDQIIQPWQFGEDASKKTCLWLKNLPKLEPTKIVQPKYACRFCGARFLFALGDPHCPKCKRRDAAKAVYGNQTASGQNKLGPSPERAMLRGITYQGIADAMAEQWGR